MKPEQFAKNMIPLVCGKALSVKRIARKAKKTGWALVTAGKDCGNWWKYVGRFRHPAQCARKILRNPRRFRGINQFVFQGAAALKRRRGFPCYTHKKHGKVDPFKEKGYPDQTGAKSDASCTCTSLYCTGKVKGGQPGWKNQRQNTNP